MIMVMCVRLAVRTRSAFLPGKCAEQFPDQPDGQDGEEEFLHGAKIRFLGDWGTGGLGTQNPQVSIFANG